MTKARTLADLIADGVVGNAELDDGSVTLAKIANGAIGTDKIADAAVTAAKLNVQGSDIPYDNSTSGISANTLQEAIDYLNVLSGGGSAGAQATYTREEFNATAGQTTFTTANGYTLGYLQVFLNGIMLDSSDYTANDESTVVLTTGAAAGDEVTTIAYDSFAISELLRVMNISASSPDNPINIDASGNLEVKSTSGSQLKTHLTGVTSLGVGPSIDMQLTQTNAQSARLAQISSEFISGWGGALVLSTKPANANPDNTVVGRIRIDEAGRVTMPYQPSFRAYTYVPISSSTGVIVWQSAAHNIGNHYNTSNGTFTAPVDGTYHFAGNILMEATSSTNYIRVLFRINGSSSTDFTDSLTGGSVGAFTNYSYHAVQIAQSFYLYAGDTVQMWNDNPIGSTYFQAGYGSFSGFLVG